MKARWVVIACAAAMGVFATAEIAVADLAASFAALEAEDYEGARREFEPLAKRGNRVAQYNYAVLLHKGLGGPKDSEAAVGWFEKAADQQSAQAAFALGLYYAQKEEPDAIEAYVWFRIASKLGHDNARKNLYRVTRLMTPEEARQARKLADERTSKR